MSETRDYTLHVEPETEEEANDPSFEEERTITLPVKFEVCGRCDGHGSHLTPSIGEHAYSVEEFYESFDDEEDRVEYFRRGGRYDVTCERCRGLRVEAVPDVEACARDPKLKADLAALHEQWKSEAEERDEWESESRAERMMGC